MFDIFTNPVIMNFLVTVFKTELKDLGDLRSYPWFVRQWGLSGCQRSSEWCFLWWTLDRWDGKLGLAAWTPPEVQFRNRVWRCGYWWDASLKTGLRLDLTSGSLQSHKAIYSFVVSLPVLRYASVFVLMTSVKGLVTLVKVLVTMGKTISRDSFGSM